MDERIISIPDASEIELSDQQVRHMAFGLAGIVREYFKQPGVWEKFEAWKAKSIANGDPHGLAASAKGR